MMKMGGILGKILKPHDLFLSDQAGQAGWKKDGFVEEEDEEVGFSAEETEAAERDGACVAHANEVRI